ncbi:hypothetical protein HPULCUR_000792 [Helicostylum pulchrum]|uniref:Uncharacterized protein n=1 Tax=Helicostylum pulchrum TaxID=562976 RepID=A0ABP9XKV9_9FUNG
MDSRVLTAKFKPLDGRQKLANDQVKIGKEMKIMLNELLKVGIEDPVVSGILVMDDLIYTFKMHFSGPKIYTMT